MVFQMAGVSEVRFFLVKFKGDGYHGLIGPCLGCGLAGAAA